MKTYLTEEERSALVTGLIQMGFDSATAAHLAIVAGRLPVINGVRRGRKK